MTWEPLHRETQSTLCTLSRGLNEENMQQSRRWWSLHLITNFPIPSEEERMQARKRRREEQKLQDEDASLKKMHSESISEGECDMTTSSGTGRNAWILQNSTFVAISSIYSKNDFFFLRRKKMPSYRASLRQPNGASCSPLKEDVSCLMFCG